MLLVLLTSLLLSARSVFAYSVLTHEASIDVTWDPILKPLLLRKFPHMSPEQLLRARSFAYGGSVIQDLGYYPFGSHFFSNLVHYVRSGDFVEGLLREARDPDEFAFALGALAHYSNDSVGHPVATNRAVPLMFPKLRQKYGDNVTYAESPKDHIRVEFSFDVVQAGAGAFLPDQDRQFIGFRVATQLLARAFQSTYGLELTDVFADVDRSIATYRYCVSQLFPHLTGAAWKSRRDEIARLSPAVERHAFVFAYSRADFEHEYGTDYEKPGFFVRLLTGLYRILPKIGPLKQLDFKPPTPEAETLFTTSFERATVRLRQAAQALGSVRNADLDTGRAPSLGEYTLADDTYAELLERLSHKGFEHTPGPLRRNILTFFSLHPDPQRASAKERKHWTRMQHALRQLSQTRAAD